MRKSKKSEIIQIRLTHEELQVMDRSADLFGLSRSEYARRSMQEGGRVLMREQLGRLVDGKFGKVREIKTDTGDTYRIGNAVYKTRNHVVIFDANDEMTSRDYVQGSHPLLDEFFDVLRDHDNFDGQRYRDLFTKLGLDPDCGRPAFEDRDLDIAKALEWKDPWPGSDGRNTGQINELANDVSELLRVDQQPDLKTYFKCQGALEIWAHAADKTPFEEAFERIDTARLTSSRRVAVEIDILPSWTSLEDHRLFEPRLHIDMWNRIFDHDDQGFPESFPAAFTGIAVEPDLHDERNRNWEYSSSWYKVCNLGVQRVRDRLERQGVLFLSKEDAAEYVLSEEAVYWRWRQSGDSTWQNPTFAHLKPRAPTWAEKARWAFRPPETPLRDRAGQQVAEVA